MLLPPTLLSDDEGPAIEDSDSDEEAEELDKSFTFGGILGEDGGLPLVVNKGWSYATALDTLQSSLSNQSPRVEVANLIAAKRQALHRKEVSQKRSKVSKGDDEKDDSCASNSDSDSFEGDSDQESNSKAPPDGSAWNKEDDVLKTRAGRDDTAGVDENSDDGSGGSSSSDDYDEEGAERKKAAAFFDRSDLTTAAAIDVFVQLSLSRPLLKGVAAMGFVQPTPIQAHCIPLALAGRDVCASAVTGSGKTAAFCLPILERLLHRTSGRVAAVILTPTRELAAQCLGMITTLAQFTKIRCSLVAGGAKNVILQAAELRTQPDIVVATPGRLLDHVLNSAGVSLESVEFLVLDEADRLLDLGFMDEVHELVKACPVNRQTMLFSATMNTKVDDLIKLSLKRPVRVKVSGANDGSGGKDLEVAPRLEQEFVRIRAGNEGVNRQAMLLALLTRTYQYQTIVFFDTKSLAHRMMIVCGLCGISCAELHGNLTQPQRLTALEDFRQGNVDVLLATDLAARGLDIDKVQSVINYEMPSQVETYIHRIGRTARAGRGGKSCTLIGEGRRHLMKELIKDADLKQKRSKEIMKPSMASDSGVVRSRSIPAAVVAHFVAKITSLEAHIEEVLDAEAVARMDRLAEMEVTKAQNIIEHSDEIGARPQRDWFATNKERQMTKEAANEKRKIIAEKVGTGTHRMTRKKRRSREARDALNADHNENDEEGHDDEEGAPAQRKVNIKADARSTKRDTVLKAREEAAKSIHDIDMERASKMRKLSKKGSVASGDGSLFDEEKVSFAHKSSGKVNDAVPTKSSYQFAGFDSAKKLGKKKTHHKFKSKSKYKRRK